TGKAKETMNPIGRFFDAVATGVARPESLQRRLKVCDLRRFAGEFLEGSIGVSLVKVFLELLQLGSILVRVILQPEDAVKVVQGKESPDPGVLSCEDDIGIVSEKLPGNLGRVGRVTLMVENKVELSIDGFGKDCLDLEGSADHLREVQVMFDVEKEFSHVLKIAGKNYSEMPGNGKTQEKLVFVANHARPQIFGGGITQDILVNSYPRLDLPSIESQSVGSR